MQLINYSSAMRYLRKQFDADENRWDSSPYYVMLLKLLLSTSEILLTYQSFEDKALMCREFFFLLFLLLNKIYN